MATDEQLMLAFQNGSREAFEELFARYSAALYGFFRRRIPDAARAQDLTQDAFVAVIRGIDRYEPRALVRTYVYGIAMKMVYAERRKHKMEPLDGNGVGPLRDRADDDVLWLREALARLDGPEREILMLREYDQLSYEEIAVLMEIPLNTVRSRLFRARLALKNQLNPVEAA